MVGNLIEGMTLNKALKKGFTAKKNWGKCFTFYCFLASYTRT